MSALIPVLNENGKFTYATGEIVHGSVLGVSNDADIAHSYVWIKQDDQVQSVLLSDGEWTPGEPAETTGPWVTDASVQFQAGVPKTPSV